MPRMAQQQVSQVVAERRCPNCGTRVARDAESCFMCGHDLRIQRRRRQRVSWVDALLVVAVLAVLVVWWRIAAQPRLEPGSEPALAAILPENVPLATPTAVVTIAAEAPPTPTPIPTPSAGGVIRHTVRQGETLLAIAGQYNVTVEDIQSANNITGVLIRVGDELIIPVQLPEVVENGDAPVEASGTMVESRFEYTVTPGDTVVSIAARFGSSVDAILRANGLSDQDFIRPGDVLVIPVREVPSEVLASGPVEDGPANPPFYAEPRLIGPADDAVIGREEAILLRWVSVDVLAPNEWYVLLIYPISGSARSFPSIWTKATSFRMDGDLAPPAGDSATYVWQVSVVRVKPGTGNQYALEPASPPSGMRSFSWR